MAARASSSAKTQLEKAARAYRAHKQPFYFLSDCRLCSKPRYFQKDGIILRLGDFAGRVLVHEPSIRPTPRPSTSTTRVDGDFSSIRGPDSREKWDRRIVRKRPAPATPRDEKHRSSGRVDRARCRSTGSIGGAVDQSPRSRPGGVLFFHGGWSFGFISPPTRQAGGVEGFVALTLRARSFGF